MNKVSKRKCVPWIFTFFISLFFLICNLTALKAQPVFFSQQFDNSSGLSNSCINSIFQDSDHLLWLGTWDGLNVYDGTSFHIFNYLKDNSDNSIGSNVIHQIGEDKNHNIWMRTNEGISEYDKQSGKFHHFFYDKDKVNKTLTSGYFLAVDKKGTVYSVSRFDRDFRWYDDVSKQFRKCLSEGVDATQVIKMTFDDYNRLWLLKQNGDLIICDVSGNKIKLIHLYQTVDGIAGFFLVNHQIFYISNNHGLYVQARPGALAFQKKAILPHSVRDMAFFNNHYLLDWSSKGIGEYGQDFSISRDLVRDIGLLDNIRITSLLPDNENNLWIGTDGGGILKVSEKTNFFGVVTQFPDGSPINIPVRAFTEVNGALWAGTKGNGVISIKDPWSKNRSFSTLPYFHSALDLLDNCVYALQNAGKVVYIGSDAPGISLYDCDRKKFVFWKDIKGFDKYPPFNSIHSIFYDKDSSVWLGSEGFSLIHLKINQSVNGSFSLQYLRRFNYGYGDKGPINDVIYTLTSGKNDLIWIGCRYGGLSVFNKKTEKFRTFKAFTYEGSLSNNDVLSLYHDSRDRMWIGTSYGLNWINENNINLKEPVFNKITTENGLPNNTVHGIVEDRNGYIWVSTNKGLARINPVSQKLVYFKKEDGLQSNEFSDNAVWKNSKGMLFFGGIYGFNYFQPENIHIDGEQPNLLISDFQLAGKQSNENGLLVLNRKSKTVKSYTLPHDDNFFEFRVKAIKFSNQEKYQYSYLLGGYDKMWHFLGADKRISFSNLPPGDYELKIRWSSGELLGNSETTAFRLRIQPYIWLTYPAYLAYFLIISICGYLYYNYRRNKIMLWHQLSMEHLLREKDEQLHQEQLNFFTNIAHELQTPLTLISGSLERYLNKDKQEERTKYHFLSIIGQQCSRLSYLVHQLLEFRKAEEGFLKAQYSYLNVSNLLRNIIDLFLPLSEQKNLTVSMTIEPDIWLWVDKDKLEKITFNLISNAFKHTENDQQIVCSLKADKQSDKLEILIANTGYLSDDALDNLFKRFFILDSTQQSKISSGIGLAYTKELVALLQGTVSVSCENSWVYFNVLLPLTFVPEEFNKATEYIERLEQPSFLLKTITANQQKTEKNIISENNKSSIIKSLDKDNMKSIMIIEDEPAIRYLLKDILQDNYIIYEAGDGRESLALMDKIQPDLIISDIMMPDMSGLEVCNIIKNNPNFCHIPFVILSARGALEQKTEGYEAGADAYIPKPFDTEYLLVRIRKLLEYQQKLHNLFKRDNIISNLPDAGMKKEDRTFLEKAINLIELNMENETLDAQFMEKELNMSKAHFYRRLKALSGMTPGELIKNIRLQHAALLLQNSEFTVLEIFYKTGFNNQSHFFREFRKKYDKSPTEYRDSYRLQVN